MRARALRSLAFAAVLAACSSDGAPDAEPAGAACGRPIEETIAPTIVRDELGAAESGVASDGKYVYFAPHDVQVARVPLDGGIPELVAVREQLRLLRAHGPRVCWRSLITIECHDEDKKPFEVHSVGATGRLDEHREYRDFDFDDTYAYWMIEGTVFRAPLDRSSPPVELFRGTEIGRTMAVAGGALVFSTEDFATIYVCRADDCAQPKELVSFGRPPSAIVGRLATDGRFAYVPVHLGDDTGRRGGKLVRIALDTGEMRELVTCLDESPIAVALDGDTVFLTTHAKGTWVRETSSILEDGSVYAVPVDGSRPRRLARGQPYPSRIAALPDRVLWMNENNRLDAQILMLRR